MKVQQSQPWRADDGLSVATILWGTFLKSQVSSKEYKLAHTGCVASLSPLMDSMCIATTVLHWRWRRIGLCMLSSPSHNQTAIRPTLTLCISASMLTNTLSPISPHDTLEQAPSQRRLEEPPAKPSLRLSRTTRLPPFLLAATMLLKAVATLHEAKARLASYSTAKLIHLDQSAGGAVQLGLDRLQERSRLLLRDTTTSIVRARPQRAAHLSLRSIASRGVIIHMAE